MRKVYRDHFSSLRWRLTERQFPRFPQRELLWREYRRAAMEACVDIKPWPCRSQSDALREDRAYLRLTPIAPR